MLREVSTTGGGCRRRVIDAARTAAIRRGTRQTAGTCLAEYVSCLLVGYDNLFWIADVALLWMVVSIVFVLVVVRVLVVGERLQRDTKGLHGGGIGTVA